jgi:hypothetical protein
MGSPPAKSMLRLSGRSRGYFARQEEPPLVATSMRRCKLRRRLPATFDISMGVRRTDKQLTPQVESIVIVGPQIKILRKRPSIGGRRLICNRRRSFFLKANSDPFARNDVSIERP